MKGALLISPKYFSVRISPLIEVHWLKFDTQHSLGMR
jgi:hypothetical protein